MKTKNTKEQEYGEQTKKKIEMEENKKPFPLTFRSRNFETWYRFHEDGSYEVVQKNKSCASFSFGKFQEYPTEKRADYMRAVAERHISVTGDEFQTQIAGIFNQGYEQFTHALTNEWKDDNVDGIDSELVNPGERKSITFTDEVLYSDLENITGHVAQESEVDRITREMENEKRENLY